MIIGQTPKLSQPQQPASQRHQFLYLIHLSQQDRPLTSCASCARQDGPAAENVRQLLDPFALRAALTSNADRGGGHNCGRLLSVLQVTAALLRDWGAPARMEAGLAAQADVGRQLTDASDKCAVNLQPEVKAYPACTCDTGMTP